MRIASVPFRLVAALVASTVFNAVMSVAFAADAARPAEVVQAVGRGLTWLAARQNNDGSYGTDAELFGRDPALSALAGLAFLSSGSAPGRGPYGKNIDRALDYILSCAVTRAGSDGTGGPIGLIRGPDRLGNKPMYGHGYAAMFLAECVGMSDTPELRRTLERAIDLIVASQNDRGGWRYEPYPVAVADISVTTCQLSALYAARGAGLYVPKETMERGLRFVESCQNGDGGFRYLVEDGRSGFGRTGAAMFVLDVGGSRGGDAYRKAVDYLTSALKRWESTPSWQFATVEYFYYAQFYAATALWLAGSPDDATLWNDWARFVIPRMLERQNEDGSWHSSFSSEATTAMILCVLLLPRRALPVFTQ